MEKTFSLTPAGFAFGAKVSKIGDYVAYNVDSHCVLAADASNAQDGDNICVYKAHVKGLNLLIGAVTKYGKKNNLHAFGDLDEERANLVKFFKSYEKAVFEKAVKEMLFKAKTAQRNFDAKIDAYVAAEEEARLHSQNAQKARLARFAKEAAEAKEKLDAIMANWAVGDKISTDKGVFGTVVSLDNTNYLISIKRDDNKAIVKVEPCFLHKVETIVEDLFKDFGSAQVAVARELTAIEKCEAGLATKKQVEVKGNGIISHHKYKELMAAVNRNTEELRLVEKKEVKVEVKTTTTISDLEKSLENKKVVETTSKATKAKEEVKVQKYEGPRMAIYTEEELNAMNIDEGAEQAEPEEDIDYDEFDKFYDAK